MVTSQEVRTDPCGEGTWAGTERRGNVPASIAVATRRRGLVAHHLTADGPSPMLVQRFVVTHGILSTGESLSSSYSCASDGVAAFEQPQLSDSLED